MSEKNPDAGTEGEQKSALDSLEEALVGTHQEVPGVEDEGDSAGEHDAGPPVPAHRSP